MAEQQAVSDSALCARGKVQAWSSPLQGTGFSEPVIVLRPRRKTPFASNELAFVDR